MDHRRDIDGLRAVAVLPVILFHAGLPGLTGGWLGVDVFFVISGYLITGLLLEAHHAGGISLSGFYERRARRILPALFVMLAVTTLVALMWLPPQELADYGASLGLTGAFLSNLWFMTQTGYFANAADVHPLLHTWSLAVEEQFYLVFPLLLMGLLRWRVPLLPVLIGLGVLSLGLAIWAIGPYPDQVFYFPLARAWELLIGAVQATPASGAGGCRARADPGGDGADLGVGSGAVSRGWAGCRDHRRRVDPALWRGVLRAASVDGTSGSGAGLGQLFRLSVAPTPAGPGRRAPD